VQLKKRRDRDRPLDESVLDGLARDDGDPELLYLKKRYAEEFRIAFKAALVELEPREKNILRYLVVEGLQVEQIARFYGVHRVTASKWLQTVRQRLSKRTRHKLAQRLRVEPAQVDSIIRLVQSRLEISFTCLADTRSA
jgi:RNA polymerase sigma-70 factor (ECF subfamily)